MFQPRANNTAAKNRRVNIAVLLVFVVQVLVPVGYMPAAIGSGAYVQLCPTGLGPDIMALLHPQHSATHSTTPFDTNVAPATHHAPHNMHGQMSSHELSASADQSVWAAHCPYGVFANADLALDRLVSVDSFFHQYAPIHSAQTAVVYTQYERRAHKPRAPPRLRSV